MVIKKMSFKRRSVNEHRRTGAHGIDKPIYRLYTAERSSMNV